MKNNDKLTIASLLSILLADASRNGRHRPRDFEGWALKQCAGPC